MVDSQWLRWRFLNMNLSVAANWPARYNHVGGSQMEKKSPPTTNGDRDCEAREELAKLEKKGWDKLTLREKTAFISLRAYFAHQGGLNKMHAVSGLSIRARRFRRRALRDSAPVLSN